MKKLILTALLAVSLPAVAGQFDGIYSCSVGSTSFFATLLTKSSGEAIWVASALPNSSVKGFALGNIVGTSFSATTSQGESLVIDLGNGNYGFTANFNGTPAKFNCSKVW